MSSNGLVLNLVGTCVAAKAARDLGYVDAMEDLQEGDAAGALDELADGADNAVQVMIDMWLYKQFKKAIPNGSIDTGFIKVGV